MLINKREIKNWTDYNWIYRGGAAIYYHIGRHMPNEQIIKLGRQQRLSLIVNPVSSLKRDKYKCHYFMNQYKWYNHRKFQFHKIICLREYTSSAAPAAIFTKEDSDDLKDKKGEIIAYQTWFNSNKLRRMHKSETRQHKMKKWS